MADKQTEKKQNREGLPMSEKSFKEWRQAFIDIEESINALKGNKKSK
jgi:hypothetical protein